MMAALAFTCPACGAVSHNPNDAQHRYCGRCHRFVDDPVEVSDLSDTKPRQRPRGRPKGGRPEFWFCRAEYCARVGICPDPLFCTQVDLALQLGMRALSARGSDTAIGYQSDTKGFSGESGDR